MTTIARVRVAWSGSAVNGPGVSTFYCVGPGGDLAADVKDMFDAWKSSFPAGVTWTFPSAGDTLDDNDGSLVGAWTGGPGGTISGTASGPFAQGVGARVVWETAGITGGRRVRGSTFLCPLDGDAYQDDGTIHPSTLTSLLAGATILTAATAYQLVVLTRLTPSHSGTSHDVESASMPDKISWLRSRRT